MIRADYALVRYVADPARNEPLNIGAIIWTPSGPEVELNAPAIRRVINANPHLTDGSLDYVEQFLRDRLCDAQVEQGLESVAKHASQFPISVSAPLAVMVANDLPASAHEELQRIIARLVKPTRRSGKSAGQSVRSVFSDMLQPYFDTHVQKEHWIAETRSHVPRVVDFYANSGANVAADVVLLDLKRTRDVQERADATAFKVQDVLEVHQAMRYVILCDMGSRGADYLHGTQAGTILESAGAEVFTDPGAAAKSFARELALP